MRTVPTGNTPHERVEIYDVDRCAACQCRLVYPHTIMTHVPCSCAPGGHRAWHCFGCRTWTYDPPHDETVRPLVGGAGYFGGDHAFDEGPRRR